MKNIINEQQQANKELLNKIADLEKQLADKDQERSSRKVHHDTAMEIEPSEGQVHQPRLS